MNLQNFIFKEQPEKKEEWSRDRGSFRHGYKLSLSLRLRTSQQPVNFRCFVIWRTCSVQPRSLSHTLYTDNEELGKKILKKHNGSRMRRKRTENKRKGKKALFKRYINFSKM